MKTLTLFFSGVLLTVVFSCKKESTNPDAPNKQTDTITYLVDEIPIDGHGNFDTLKCHTSNANILYSKTIANYLNYNLDDNTHGEVQKYYRCNYFIVNGSDTLFNCLQLIFNPNVGWTTVSTNETQYKTADFGKIDPITKKPYYKGTLYNIQEERDYAVYSDTMEIAQKPTETTDIYYKLICIQKNEDYLKVLVSGKYCVKLVLQRDPSCPYPKFVKMMDATRADKYFFDKNFTTLNFTNQTSFLFSF